MNHLRVHDVVLRCDASVIESDIAGYPQQNFVTIFNLDSEPADREKLPAVQVHFSGFQCLCTEPTVAQQLGSNWAALAFGTLVFHEDMVDPNCGWTDKDVEWIKKFIASLTLQIYGMENDTVHFQSHLTMDSPKTAVFVLARKIPQEEWQRAYHSKSLEMTAAYEYFKSIGGQMMVEPAVPEDLAHNRTLN